MSPSNRPFY